MSLNPNEDALPAFNEDLAEKIKTRSDPLPQLPSNLVKKRVPSFFRKGVKRSLIFHASLAALVLVSDSIHWPFQSAKERQAILAEQSPKAAIRVDLVDLPDLKLDELRKVDLSEDVAKSDPEEKKPSKNVMVDPTKKEAVKEAPKKETKKEEKIPAKLKEIRERLKADLKRQELVARLKSNAKEGHEGRRLLRGNMVSEGYSVTGDVATDSGVYTGKALAHIKKNWTVPGWMAASKLKARVLVKIGPDGRLLSKEFTKKSGNSEFDNEVMNSLNASDPFPAPPELLKRKMMEEGIEWGFPQ